MLKNENEQLSDNYVLHNKARSLRNNIAPNYDGAPSKWWPFQAMHEELLSVGEYFALQAVSIARNYDGIAHAQAEKPKRQIDKDVCILEQPLYVDGTEGTSFGGEAHVENLGDVKSATLRQNVNLAHHFNESDLKDIFDFDTSDRKQAFVKELEETAFIWDGELPPPTEHKKVAIRREVLNDRLLAPFQGLAHLDDLLADVIGKQKKTFGKASLETCPEDDQEDDIDVPPDADGDDTTRPTVREECHAQAKFAPSDS